MKWLLPLWVASALLVLPYVVQPAAAQDDARALPALGTAQLARCFDLQAEEAATVLGEAVNPTWSLDEQTGYCIFASVAASQASNNDDLLPTYGPISEHHYVAITVWPVGSATDPLTYLAFAILDRDHGRLNEFYNQFGLTDLAALAKTPSQRPALTRQFLPEVGDGALWYWQETSTGHHLAGIYGLHQNRRIAVQVWVAPGREEAVVREALSQLVATLIATAPHVQVPPTPTPWPTFTPTPPPRPTPTPSAAEKATALLWQQYAHKIAARIGKLPKITAPALAGAVSEAQARRRVEEAWLAVRTASQPYQAVMMASFMGAPMLLGETAALSAERMQAKTWNVSTKSQMECVEYDGELLMKRRSGWVAVGSAAAQPGELTPCQQLFSWPFIDPFAPLTTDGGAAIDVRITVSALGQGKFKGQTLEVYQVLRVVTTTGEEISKTEFYLAADSGLPLFIHYMPTLVAPFPLNVVTRLEYPANVVVKKPLP